jgi:hypothetical protein
MYLGLSNYYGSVEAYEKDGKYFMSLENWDGDDIIEVSEEFYKAIEKEFGGEEE